MKFVKAIKTKTKFLPPSLNGKENKMKNPLNKRFPRDLKSDFGKYIAIFLFLTFFIGGVSGFLVADNSVIATYNEGIEKYNVEDGHLSFNIKPSDKLLNEIEEQNDLKLYNLSYKEEDIDKKGTTVRIYKKRDKINRECVHFGKMPNLKNEIALDRMFAVNNNIAIGDKVTLKGKQYKVCGLISLADYSALFESNADMMFDAVGFGVAVMSEEGYSTLPNSHETINYAWKYNKKPFDESDENSKSEKLTNSLESLLKEYDEPIIQKQVDNLYSKAKPTVKSLEEESKKAESELETKYLTAIRKAGIGNDKGIAKELGITTKQYTNLKNTLEDAQNNENDYNFDSLNSAPKINLDDYKNSDDFDDFDKMFDEAYKVVDAISEAKLYDCTKLYKDLSTLKKLVKNFKFDDSKVITVKDYSAKYTNKAIMYTIEDSGSDKATMMLMMYIIMLVIAFLFAVTTSNTITKEANVIGTLRASGYSKGELIRHYLFMPMIVTIVAGIIGNALGYTVFQKAFESVYYANYSLAKYKMLWNGEAFLETTVVPFIIMLAINLLVLIKKLKISPLNFIRGELKENGAKKVIKLPKKMHFFSKYRLRILFQNIPSYITMFIGIFLAGLLVVIGSMYGPLLDDYSDLVKENMISKYQYIMLNEKETTNDVAEKFCLTTLETTDKKFITDDVTVYGIANNSKYITKSIPSGEVLVSSAMMQKFSLKPDDIVTLKEKYTDKTYTFKIADDYTYDASITVFMNRSDYLKMFNEDKDYFTGYFSNSQLSDLSDDDIATVITVKDLTKIVTQMQVSMSEFVKIFKALGVVIFLLIMYILTKQIIERNTKSISMSKILGFSDIEIGRLYLIITSIMVIVSLFVCIPLIKVTLGWMFKSYLYTQMTGYVPYIVSNSCYVTMVVLGIVSYAVVCAVMLIKIKKTNLGDALKNQSF